MMLYLGQNVLALCIFFTFTTWTIIYAYYVRAKSMVEGETLSTRNFDGMTLYGEVPQNSKKYKVIVFNTFKIFIWLY